MSRDIDLDNMSEADTEYVAQRPWLQAELEADRSDEAVAAEDEDSSYDDLTVAALLQMLEVRNEGMVEDLKIVPKSNRKADLVQALEDDDDESEDDE